MKNKVIIELAETWLKVSVDRRVAVEPLVSTDALAISTALSSILKQKKCGKDFDAFVVFSRNKITIRRVDLPSQDPKEIEQMLGLYIMRQVPYHKEEICWAYQNLGFDGVSSSHLILAIALKNVFRNIVSSFIPIDILPEAILMSSQGLLHYVEDNCKDKSLLQGSYLILDIDTNYSDLILAHNNKLDLSIVIPQGAEQLKNESSKEKFAIELKQALAALNNEVADAKYDRLFLTGAAQDQARFMEAILAKDFNLKVQYLASKEYDSFISANSRVKDISLSAILGFSSRVSSDDIKFLVPEVQIKKEMKSKVQQLLILGVCLVYILVSLGGITLLKLIQRQSYAAYLKAQVVTMSKEAKNLDDITNKLKIARQFIDSKDSALASLYSLNQLCPDSITITNYNWEWGKRLSFRGYAQQIPDILAFTNTLSNSESFKGAQNRYTRRRKLKEKDVVDFEVVVR